MNKVAIVIGVNETGRMPQLQAAAQGANDFADWAESQGFKVKRFTDQKKPVTVKAITTAIQKICKDRNCEQLVIFFSGHGVLRSPSDEIWLLSNAPGDVNEAVLVGASKDMARESGIPHVVFISDACRSIPADPAVSAVRGSVIFGMGYKRHDDPMVDVFYAVNPGNTAYEVKQAKAVKNYNAVFTKCMLDALDGNDPTIISTITINGKKQGVIHARPLWEYLRREVPRAAKKSKVRQTPDAIITSVPPKFIGTVKGSFTKGTRSRKIYWGDGNRVGPILMEQLGKYNQGLGGLETIVLGYPPEGPDPKEQRDKAEKVSIIRDAKKHIGDEIGTGFVVTGADSTKMLVGDDREVRFAKTPATQVYETNPSRKTALLQLSDNSIVPLAVLEGFVGNVVIQKNLVVSVSYSPSVGTEKYNDAAANDDYIKQRRAQIAASGHFGKFEVPGSPMMLIATAGYLREWKSLDPSLGLFATYAYLQAGDIDGIKSVLSFMIEEPEALLYDIALFNSLYESELLDPKKAVAPFCPMLTQGWSYISIPASSKKKNPSKKLLDELSLHLKPGLWTTFDAKALPIIQSAFKNKNIQ